MKKALAFDIGGTKCAVTLGKIEGESISIVKKKQFATAGNTYMQVLERFCDVIDKVAEGVTFESIGISCGGPLNAQKGVIMSPPNLIGWNNVKICEYLEDKCGAKVYMPHTGQKYIIGDAVLEILSSIDDTIHVSDDINPTSLFIRMELGGQVILWSADASYSHGFIPERYGNFLKADILQIPALP